ncbi:MAG TPA: hypothetical protein VHY79_02110 [Rhizomicrobium sp.]|nr:hypothetical protein [Rhizomicrobium sp.]
MAISFEAKSDATPIEVEDLIGAARKVHRGDSIETMQYVAGKLQCLAANREFIRDALLEELRRIASERHLASFAPQSFTIYRAAPFSLRLNLWLPPAGSARKIGQEARILSYDRAHDHNFSLLTVGAAGPGYKTRVFEYDSRSIGGYAGEFVEITYLEDTALPIGKAMIYRPSRDIHIQIPPDRPSMSLNLLVAEKEIVEVPQYFFDLETSSLAIMDANEIGRRASFLEAVGHFADETCASLLFDVARQSRNPSIRAAAMRAIGTGFPERQHEIERLAEADGHPLVVREARFTPTEAPPA